MSSGGGAIRCGPVTLVLPSTYGIVWRRCRIFRPLTYFETLPRAQLARVALLLQCNLNSCRELPSVIARKRHPEAPQTAGGRERHRSEEHTSELQSLRHLVCRLLLE